MAKHSGIKDSGEYFVISPTSRKVIVPHIHKSIGTVGDHNSEQITFMCPQIVDGHDVSQCAYRYVTWINVNNEIGHDELKQIEVEQGEEGMIYLAWTIRNSMTVAKGIVHFSVHFEDEDADGTTLYRWSTATCKDCDILESINGVLGAYETMYVSDETLVVSDYALVNDNILKLETYGIFPTGTLKVTENGTYEVTNYERAEVSVDPPSGTLNITRNGTHFVAEYAMVNVNVPDSIDPPSGTFIIDKNGTYNVEKYADVLVEVPKLVDNTAYVRLVNTSNAIADITYTNVMNNGTVALSVAVLSKNGELLLEIIPNTLLVCNFDAVDIDYTSQNINLLCQKNGCVVFCPQKGQAEITFNTVKG